MSNRQIQPVRPRDYQLARQVRPRSLWGQIWTITLQPGYFFRTLPPANDTRQWFWAAVLILALVGFSAIRQDAVKNPSTDTSSPPIDFSSPPGTDLGVPGKSIGGGGVSIVPVSPGGGSPTDSGNGAVAPANTPSADVSATLTIGLIAASHILLGWFILALILCEIALFNGTRPSFGQNLQIAIWASVPLGIMAGLQVVYYAAGGVVGQDGLAGLLSSWKGYDGLSLFPKSLALSLAIRVTLFWLWSLLLIYWGGRYALNGKRWAVMLVVAAWVIVLVVTPVIAGTISAEPSAATAIQTDNSNFPLDTTGLDNPSLDLNNSADGTLAVPTELQFLLQPSDATPEGTNESSFTSEATAIPKSTAGPKG